jgi:hypothetical protein
VVLLGSASCSTRTRAAASPRDRADDRKAFLIDMSTLTGVYRALSFMCLGLVLVAIGWLYQRILFRRQAAALRRRPERHRRRCQPDPYRWEFATSSLSGCCRTTARAAEMNLRGRRSGLGRAAAARRDVWGDLLRPCAACWMLREISCVAALLSTAAAMVEAISDMRPMCRRSPDAPTDSWVAPGCPRSAG